MALNSPGIGSGLDVKSLVTQLVNASAQGPSVRFNKQEAQLQAKISGLGTLKGALSDFKSSLSGVNNAGSYNQKTASNTDSSIFTVSANSQATAGSYSVVVSSLAKSQKLASNVFADSTASIGTGTLSFRFGTYDSGGNTFTANSEKATETITIDSSNDSLQGIRDAVNDADIGVTATIINDGTGSRIVFTSDDTGADNSLEITVSDDSVGTDTDTTGLSQLAYDPTAAVDAGKNIEEKVTASSASLSIDGINVTSSTNTIADAIEGVTLELLKEDDATTATVTISEDRSAITGAVNNFISAYNKLISTTNQLSSFNKDTGEAGILLGDATLRGVNSQIRRVLSDSVAGLSGSYTSLINLGIKTQESGALSLDSSKLNKALDDDFDSVAKVFAAVGAASDSLVNVNGFSDDTVAGSYEVNISQLATHGNYAGATTTGFPITINADDDSFKLKVDGATSGSIVLTAGTYNTSADLVTELQAQIDADATLKNTDRSITVSFDSDHFVFTSERYGSDSTVSIESSAAGIEADLGLSTTAGTSTDGLNVAGTIGGVAATGTGQTLKGAGDASGLSLEITGNNTGDRGTIDFTRGIADRLDDVLGSLLDSDGIFNSRTNSLQSRVEDINDQREALAQRLEALEQRYLRQFNAMDALVAQLQSTSNFLSSQLNSTPFANINK